MALIDGTHFFKTQKEESKKIFAKYSRQNNEGYLEAGYQANAKLFERVPFVTKEGMEIQIKEALVRKPGAIFRVNEVVDDSIVMESGKGRLYRSHLQVVICNVSTPKSSPPNVLIGGPGEVSRFPIEAFGNDRLSSLKIAFGIHIDH